MAGSWNTKWGSRRVRHEPPTLLEALAAVQGFAEDRDAQIELAAGLMGVPLAEARVEILRSGPARRLSSTVPAPTRGRSGARTVLVERKPALRAGHASQRGSARPSRFP